MPLRRTKRAIPADPWLRHLEHHIPIARAGVDAEGAHQMRVAIAHLRVWLALAGLRVLDDDLRWLRDRIAPLRDLDVQLAREPPPSVAARLLRMHRHAHRDVVDAIDDARVASLLLALSYLPALPEERARGAVPRIARRVLRRARAVEHREADLDALHRLRRVVRRLRFALEWLEEDAADLVILQDALGDACDAAVALRATRRQRGRRVRRYRSVLKRHRRTAEEHAHAALRRVRPRLEEIASCSSS